MSGWQASALPLRSSELVTGKRAGGGVGSGWGPGKGHQLTEAKGAVGQQQVTEGDISDALPTACHFQQQILPRAWLGRGTAPSLGSRPVVERDGDESILTRLGTVPGDKQAVP